MARDDDGGTWSAVFSDGKFTVTQPADGRAGDDAQADRPDVPRDVRRGHRGAARKRASACAACGATGTGASARRATTRPPRCAARAGCTEDRCDGTLTRVERGAVEVEDFTDPVPRRRRPRRPRPGPRAAGARAGAGGAARRATGSCPPAGRTSPAPEADDVPWVEVFAVLLVCHAVGDFLLQTEWQATHKRGRARPRPRAPPRARRPRRRRTRSPSSPALAWLAGDLGAGGIAALAAGVFVPHLVQDDGRLLSAYVRTVKRTEPAPGMLMLAVDQSFHLVVLFGLAVAAGA